MANHAHSTRTPLLRLVGAQSALLPLGAGRQLGPVSTALAAMHAADPDRQRIRTLRKAIGDRIEADIALLDALAGDADLEDGGDDEPSLCGAGTHQGGSLHGLHPSQGGDDREDGDDNGIRDTGGLAEQRGRYLRLIAGGTV